uniref:Secreted protein n=1 Tax=Pyxicephalus adspersus TaxID=30357 RepID=A0AAV3A1J7_PYXAD|nr:TPA: hypothetical protein GDO54_002900 [Pyxicephalus adspersus]
MFTIWSVVTLYSVPPSQSTCKRTRTCKYICLLKFPFFFQQCSTVSTAKCDRFCFLFKLCQKKELHCLVLYISVNHLCSVYYTQHVPLRDGH